MATSEAPAGASLRGESLRRALDDQHGYVVLPRCIGDELRRRALRRLNLEILRCGLTSEQIWEWKHGTFWPTLRSEPEILALRTPLAAAVEPLPDERWGEAQLLLRFPDEADDWPLSPHVDELPQWATGVEYRAIFGVALTRSRSEDGCLAVWPGSHRGITGDPVLVEMDAGDVVVMHPALQHCSTLHRGGEIRYAVYLRLLGPTGSSG
jgi:hypothetical protein